MSYGALDHDIEHDDLCISPPGGGGGGGGSVWKRVLTVAQLPWSCGCCEQKSNLFILGFLFMWMHSKLFYK